MKRKLISMICALSMIFSVLGSFAVLNVYAADQGVTATAEVEDDNLVIDVSYAGMEGGLTTALVRVYLDPAKVDGSSATLALNTADMGAVTIDTSYYDSASNCYVIGVVYTGTTPESAVLGTITAPLVDSAEYPVEVTILGTTYVSDSNKVKYTYAAADTDTLTVTGATVEEPAATEAPTEEPTEAPTVDPDATEAPTARPTLDPDSRPTKVPVVTEAPAEETTAPTDAPVLLDQNVTLDAEVEDSNLVIDVSYAGMTGGLTTALIRVYLDPAKVTGSSATLAVNETDMGKATIDTSYYDAASNCYVIGLVYTGSTPESGVIATITAPLADGVEYPIAVTVPATTYISDSNKVKYTYDGADSDTLSVLGTTVSATPVATEEPAATDEPVATEEPEVFVEIAVSAVISTDAAAYIEENKSTNEIGLEVTFKDANGNTLDLTYGKDFVVVDSEGNTLTADEYTDLVNGYDTETLAGLLTGDAKFVIYNENVASIDTDVVDWTNGYGEYIGDTNTTPTVEEPDATTAPTKAPTDKDADGGYWDVTESVSVRVGNTATLKATYIDGDGTKHTYSKGEVLFEVTDGEKYAELEDDDSNKIEGVKRGTATVTAYYVDEDGTKLRDSAGDRISTEITVKVSSASSGSSGSSGSSSSSSGSGDVASGNYSNNATINYTVTFSDLDDVTWAQTAIYGLAGKNVIAGYEDGTFRPNNNITRAEFAKLLVLTFGYGSFTGASASFADVPSTHWAYDYVAIAYTLGAITGYDANTFGPEDYITREQMATMIYRLVKNYDVDLDLVESAITFDDDWAISDYAKEAVSTLQQADVINGMGDGTFAPQDNATRAQAAVMLYKFI